MSAVRAHQSETGNDHTPTWDDFCTVASLAFTDFVTAVVRRTYEVIPYAPAEDVIGIRFQVFQVISAFMQAEETLYNNVETLDDIALLNDSLYPRFHQLLELLLPSETDD